MGRMLGSTVQDRVQRAAAPFVMRAVVVTTLSIMMNTTIGP